MAGRPHPDPKGTRPPWTQRPRPDRQRSPIDTGEVPGVLVIRERTGHVEVLTLNRPEAANSLNPPAHGRAGDGTARDPGRRRGPGGGGHREPGAGLLRRHGPQRPLASSTRDRPTPGDPEGAGTLAAFLGGSYPKPLVAAVNGAAVGGGLELVMACDLVVAAEHARFGLPEVKRGLYAAGGGTLLSIRIPQALALEMGLTGRLIGAERAAQAGLVNQVVPAAELLAAASALAAEVAANGPLGCPADQDA